MRGMRRWAHGLLEVPGDAAREEERLTGHPSIENDGGTPQAVVLVQGVKVPVLGGGRVEDGACVVGYGVGETPSSRHVLAELRRDRLGGEDPVVRGDESIGCVVELTDPFAR